jgi:putative photosynthetic complex assembly protein 2
MTESPWLAAAAALVLWWLSTGLILWRVRAADNAGANQHVWSVLATVPLLVLGIVGAGETLQDTTVGGVYLAFASALAIWGWIELAFLSGVITGPNRAPCPPDVSGPERFVRAVGTIAWHEIALAAALGWLVWRTRGVGAENHIAALTFGVLFAARISAKLNLFLGVPRINTEFLPRPLAHLPSHFRIAPINWLFPISITLLALASGCWLERAWAAQTQAGVVGFALIAALTLLALLEHWFMVLPVPDQKLWRWMMPAPQTPPQAALRGWPGASQKRGPHTPCLQEDPNGL